MLNNDPRSLPAEELFVHIAEANENELRRLLGTPDLGLKDVMLAELDRRRTQAVNRQLLELNRRIAGLAGFAVMVAIVAIGVAVGVALHWGPF